VIFGWLFGVITLGFILLLWKPIAALIAEQTLGNRFLIALGASFVFILIELVPYLWLQINFEVPQGWIALAISATAGERIPAPVTIEGAWSNAGVFFGLMCGFIWLNQRGGINVDGKFWEKAVRYLVGLVGVLLLWRGLSVVFGLLTFNELLTFLLRYLRYALTGLWISAGAPLLFIRLKWMRTS
jgi:hypothetical protein